MTLKLGNLTYPIIKSSSSTSTDFIDKSNYHIEVTLLIEIVDGNQHLFVKYIHNLKNDYIQNLIYEKKANVFISVYCGETLFKQSFCLDSDRGSIDLGYGNVIGNLEIQSMIVSAIKLENYNPPNVNPEYLTDSFELNAGSILAMGEREIFPVSFERIDLQSLIRVQLALEKQPNTFEINLESNVITIMMGKNSMAAWELMRTDKALKPFLYISIYKDTFVEALSLLALNSESHEYVWAQKLIEKCVELGIKVESLTDFSAQNQAALLLLGSFGMQRLVKND
jgi:hypothetical protein